MLRKFNKYEDSLIKTLANLNLHWVKNIGQTISSLEYSCTIDSVMYTFTHSNITYKVNKLNRFIKQSRKSSLEGNNQGSYIPNVHSILWIMLHNIFNCTWKV